MTVAEPSAGSIPQELAPRRTHPVSPFIGLVPQLRQLVLPLGFSLVLGRGDDSSFRQVFFIGLPLVFALGLFLSWRRFTYRIEGGALIVDSGIINRRRREIPIERVHHVEENAKLLHRLFGVVKLQIDSGGGESGAEISLDALSRGEAARLRALLGGNPADPDPIIGPSSSTAAAPLVRLGVGSLILAGVTNVPFVATLGVMGSVSQLVDELSDEFVESAADRVPPTAAGIGGVIAFIAIAYVVAAGGASVFSNYGYLLERDGDELRTKRGLLDRRRAVVDLDKLTVLRLDETIMRRALKVCSFRLQTISGGGGPFGIARLSIPLLPTAEVDRVVAGLMPMASPMPRLVSHPSAARRRIYIRRLAIALAMATALAWFWRPPGLLVGALLLALAACRAEVAYRALGHATRDGVLISREGGLRRETAITTWQRTESTRIRSSPLQRWAGVATLYVDIPQGRSVAVADADPADLAQLRNLALL